MPPRLDFPAVELSFPASVDTGDRNCGRQQKAYQITGEASASVGGGRGPVPGKRPIRESLQKANETQSVEMTALGAREK